MSLILKERQGECFYRHPAKCFYGDDSMKKLHRLFSVMLLIFILSGVNEIKVQAEDGAFPFTTDGSEIETKIMEYIKEHQDTTAGLAYSVFSGSEDLITGYYGYADIENHISVDDETVFEWGSASKIMVWISVMQLAEQGKLDFNADIREYLPSGFLSNVRYDSAITMVNLMNHSAGFQEDYVDLFVKDCTDFTCLEDALAAHKPEQIFEPGTVTAYSNWSTALAAFVVERVSGMGYVEYVHQNIFEPLGMEHSAIAMDLSDNEWVAAKRKELKSYDVNAALLPDSFYYITLYPAGMCTSTLEDFKKFAKSLLEEESVLFQKEGTRQLFFTPSDYYSGTDVPRNYHGLWMIPLGVQTIGHGGNTAGCSSYLLLELNSKIGMVVMTNQANEVIYNIQMPELIYGKYEDANYGFDKGNPEGVYKTARTFRVGPLKILNMSYSSPESEEGLWVVTEEGGFRRIEYPYTDYYGITIGEMIFELCIVGLCLLLVSFNIIALIVRGIKRILKIRKKIPTKKLAVWSTMSTGTEILTLTLLFYVAKNVSTYALGSNYQWAIAAIGIMAIVMSVLAVWGIFGNVKANLKNIDKRYNIIIGITQMRMVDKVI